MYSFPFHRSQNFHQEKWWNRIHKIQLLYHNYPSVWWVFCSSFHPPILFKKWRKKKDWKKKQTLFPNFAIFFWFFFTKLSTIPFSTNYSRFSLFFQQFHCQNILPCPNTKTSPFSIKKRSECIDQKSKSLKRKDLWKPSIKIEWNAKDIFFFLIFFFFLLEKNRKKKILN